MADRLFVDSTLVQANASLESAAARALLEQPPGVAEHVAAQWRENAVGAALAVELAMADQAMLKRPLIGREKPWHQDHAFFSVPVRTRVVGAWVALMERM